MEIGWRNNPVGTHFLSIPPKLAGCSVDQNHARNGPGLPVRGVTQIVSPMNPEVLEKILACNKLPTLPAVAMRVVELTNNDNVSMKSLADAIQNDQALAAKVLRTVNSSLYGLRQRCSCINQAIVMLGLSAVKTLALGFTLVGAIKDSTDDGLDMGEHWRRALCTAIAAKAIATHARLPNPEECFLGGLLQDIGMIALYITLGHDYTRVIAEARGDHRAIVRLELASLATQHPDVGAMLVGRWKLPDALVMPIKYHERPTAAPQEHISTCRAVGLGNLVADILSMPPNAVALRRYYKSAESWFGMTEPQADDVLKLVSHQKREVAALLSVPTAAVADAADIIRQARKLLGSMDVIEQYAATDDGGRSPGVDASQDPHTTDELTGVAGRRRFDQTFIAAFEQARAAPTPLALAIFAVDGLDQITTDFGPDVRDTVLIAISGRLERAFASVHALVGRFDTDRFAVLLPKLDRFSAVRLTEEARRTITREPVGLIAARAGSPPTLSVTTSVGLATLDAESAARFDEPGALLSVVEQAVRDARKSGTNALRVFAPARKAA